MSSFLAGSSRCSSCSASVRKTSASAARSAVGEPRQVRKQVRTREATIAYPGTPMTSRTDRGNWDPTRIR
jgi:hypothetical protein